VASKKDLVEAQSFSRRRLLTAFASGAPGGRELEPTKPLRAVVGGIALTAFVVLGSLGFGMLSPTLPDGWDDNSLVLTTDSGSRYVALGGVLYPVLNTTSARLLIPADAFEIRKVTEDKIADTERGATVGITGAPDALPAASRLISTGWLSCASATGSTATVLSAGTVATRIGADVAAVSAADAAAAPGARPAAPGVLVETAGDLYLVTGDSRHLVPRAHVAAVLRAIGQDTAVPWPATARWLNLVPPGTDLDPVVLDGAGSPIPAGVAAAPGALVGSVLTVTDAGDQRYVVDAAGELAALSGFAGPLYRLGSGAEIAPDIEVTTAQIAGMRTSSAAVAPADWPATTPAPVPDGDVACAFLSTKDGAEGPRVHLVSTAAVAVPETGDEVRIDPAAGALVRASGLPGVDGAVQLIDQTGTAFAVPDTSDELLARLRFRAANITAVPAAWLSLFAAGPALTEEAAQQSPQPPAGT
jgi:type VII secretion protein EccB